MTTTCDIKSIIEKHLRWHTHIIIKAVVHETLCILHVAINAKMFELI